MIKFFKTMNSFFKSRWLGLCIFILGLFLSCFLFWDLEKGLKEKERAYFGRQVQKLTQAMQDRMSGYKAVLKGARALFGASQNVQREEWTQYVNTLELSQNYPGFAALAYVRSVPKNDLPQFTSTIKKEGFPDFHVWPLTNHPDDWVVTYTEPFEATRSVLGFDVRSEAARAEAAELARDTGQGSITRKVKLMDKAKNTGVLFFLPIYQHRLPHKTLEERRQALEGWVVGAFNIENLMKDLLGEHSPEIDFEIFDGPQMNSETLLYDDDHELHAIDKNYHPLFTDISTLPIGGKTWTLYFTTRASFMSAMDRSKPKIVLAGGFILSVLLFALVHALSSTRARAQTMAKKMTEELAEVAAMRKAILDGSNYSIISTDVNGTIQSFNSAAERMLGYSAEEVVEKKTPEIIHDLSEVLNRAKELSQELGKEIKPGFEVFVAKPKQGVPEELEWTYIRKNGSRFPVLLSVTPIRQSDGAISGFLGVASDITERKKIEQMKKEFISIVSHELRTPLTSIQGSLGLMKGGATGLLPEAAKTLIDPALESCERLGRLVSDILDVEKIESGKMEFNLKILRLAPLIEQALEANRLYAQKFEVKLHFANEADPLTCAKIDPDRFTQVLTNLISNAVKFSPRHHGVSVKLSPSPGKHETVRISVIDAGPGIPEKFRTRIFQKFTQANPSDPRARSGSGLGLSISKAIVESWGGKIGFESEAKQGSTFYFDLPRSEDQEELSSTSQNIPEKPKEITPTFLKRVICVEDDDKIRAITELALKVGNFTSLMCGSGQEALENVLAFHPDLILLDVMMPEMDGPSTLQALRRIPELKHTPIIFMTAKAQTHEIEQYKALGAIGVIVKPFDPMTLATTLTQIWRKQNAA